MSDEDERRRALERAVAVVLVVDGGRRDAVAGVLAAAALALGAWLWSARWLVAAIVLALALPVAARLSRWLRARRLQRQFAADPQLAAQREADALTRATPGQRAALMMMITKPRG